MRKLSGYSLSTVCHSSSYSSESVFATPRKSHARPLYTAPYGVFSVKRRRMTVRYGAMPVPVATMIRSTLGSFSGMSMTLPDGPVSFTSSPGFESHRKLEHTPFLAGSSALSSGHQYVARRTQSVVFVPVMSSPYRVEAIEYRRTEFGLPFFGLRPGGITPYDWPSQYGISPPWSMTMSHVSPVASGPTMRLTLTTLAILGALFLNVFTGTADWSQYGSASRKSSMPPAAGAAIVTPLPLPSYDLRQLLSAMMVVPTRDCETRLAGRPW